MLEIIQRIDINVLYLSIGILSMALLHAIQHINVHCRLYPLILLVMLLIQIFYIYASLRNNQLLMTISDLTYDLYFMLFPFILIICKKGEYAT